jgi:hypothetical protein
MTMSHNKHAWITVIAFALALTVVGVGRPASGGGEFEGIGEVVLKGFAAINFHGPDWKLNEKDQKKGTSDYKCNGDEGCYFEVLFENVGDCVFPGANSGSASACFGGFVEKPQQPALLGFNARYHCEKDAVVTTFNDLLWIPQLCYPDIVDD